MSPYVGMARKQNGGYNASTSVQTPIVHLVMNSTHLKTVTDILVLAEQCEVTCVTVRVSNFFS